MADYSGAYEPIPKLSGEALYRRNNPLVIRYLSDGYALLETVVHKEYLGRIHIPGHGWFEVLSSRREAERSLTYTLVKKAEPIEEKWTTA